MNPGFLSAVVAFTLAAAAPAFAEKPEWAGGGKGKGKGHAAKEEPGPVRGARVERYFADSHRTYVREFYVQEHRSGFCPPGLAKKRNGCMPPGQAKKWRMGQRLPRDAVMYELEPALVAKIGAPPPGYRFVRVASDILMTAIGTGMVVDAIEDLGRL